MRQEGFSGASFDNLGQVQLDTGPETTRLSLVEVRMLYALAESDWGWLADRDLANRGRTSPSETAKSLANLAAAGLASPGGAPSERPEPVTHITDLGLQLITWLSRDWPGWHEYSQRFGFDVY